MESEDLALAIASAIRRAGDVEGDVADLAVARVVADLKGRRGLRQEWEQIDDDIQAEIREVWAGIIRVTLAGGGDS